MASTSHGSAYLRAIVSALQSDLVPLEKPDYAAQRLELAQTVLLRMAVDSDEAAMTDVVSGVRELFPNTALDDLPAAIRAVLDRDPSEGKREAALTFALAEARPKTPRERQALAALVRVAASVEHRRRDRIEMELVVQRKAMLEKKTSREEVVLDERALSAYLQTRFPELKEVRAENVSPVPGGRSKATIFFDLVHSGGARRLVMRKDFAKDFMNTTVATEFPIVRAAWEAGLRVPEPLWLEEDAPLFSGKFIIFVRLPGGPAGTMFETNASRELVLGLAGVMARLHTLDVRARGLLDHLDFGRAEFPVQAMVEKSYAKHRALCPDNVVFECAHHWLRSRLDCVERKPALVHGDAGLNNVLADGDSVSALLDWELSHAGDPAEDLASCKDLAATVLPWREFMAEYVRQGGEHVSPEREHFFVVWRLVKYGLYAASARQMFESGRDPDLRLAAIGYNTYARLLNTLSREIST